MIYKEFQPNLLLTPYIETYWTAYRLHEPTGSPRILPDGCVDIILTLHSSAPFGSNPFCPNIIGTMTTFCHSSYTNDVDLFGIRFRPAGFTAFCKIPIHEFTDKRIDLTSVESLFDERFFAELPEKETMLEVIRYVDSYLLRKRPLFFTPEPQVTYSVGLIRQSKGTLPLKEIADKSCLSLRHFERKFKTAVGISPKTFSKVVKFQNTCNYIKTHKEASLLAVAVDCGYYDQAHLIKDFKALSGNTPSDFRQ